MENKMFLLFKHRRGVSHKTDRLIQIPLWCYFWLYFVCMWGLGLWIRLCKKFCSVFELSDNFIPLCVSLCSNTILTFRSFGQHILASGTKRVRIKLRATSRDLVNTHGLSLPVDLMLSLWMKQVVISAASNRTFILKRSLDFWNRPYCQNRHTNHHKSGIFLQFVNLQ